ncbi:MAG TPA: prolyl oligopeptidase family serine peptidase, partial [Allosphingosinicella sp.]|nr:prolyl oligopeptidase family serine peptidase [Allosphingosinicella sp.]
MQIGWALFLVSLAATPVPSSAPPAPTAPGPVPFMEPLHGEPRFDPYRWMEEAGSAFDGWARQESDWTRQLLDGLPGRARLHARIEQLDRPSPGLGSFQARGGRWLYTRVGDQASARTTFLREEGQGAERPLDLLRTLPSEEGPWSEVVHARVLSPNGRYLAFGTTRRGEADPSLRVYDLQTMQLLPDLVTWPLWADSSGFRPRWLADSSGFLYVRRPDADAAMDARERARRGQVFLHRLGTATAQDEPLFCFGLTHGIEETDTLYVDGEPDPRWLSVLNRKPAGREIWVADLSSGIGRNPPRRVYASDELVPGFGVLGDRLYTLDSDGAERYRVVAVDLAGAAAGAPVEVLPQQEGVLGNLQVSADAVYVVETRLDSSRLHIIDESGHRAIDLPQGSVESIAAGPEGRGVWIETTSWLNPRSGWLVEPGAERARSLDSAASTPTASNPANLIELEWAVARDGVRVPYTIVRRANAPRDGSGYVLMSGYGCFGTVNSPFYWPALEAWLEQGGIFVLAHMRGGGELGAGWHLAGSDRNKATSFEDAIDTARQLVRNGWTRP